MLSVVSGVSHSLTAIVDWRRGHFGPWVSLVLAVPYATWSYFANHFALNPRVGPGYSCCSARSDMDGKRTLFRRGSQHRRSQNSARLTARFDSLKAKRLQYCERADFRVRLLPRRTKLWTISPVWQVFSMLAVKFQGNQSLARSGLNHSCLKYLSLAWCH